MIDSHQPRFSQGVLALALAIAFLLDAEIMVPVLAVILLASALGGPRWNVFAYAYRALPIPRGEPEPAAPPRFAQLVGTIFLAISSVALLTAEPDSSTYDVIGWGAALVVAVLAALAAVTSF